MLLLRLLLLVILLRPKNGSCEPRLVRNGESSHGAVTPPTNTATTHNCHTSTAPTATQPQIVAAASAAA